MGDLWPIRGRRQYVLHAHAGLALKAPQSGEVPHTSIDVEAHWTKRGWHGWVYGRKLQLLTVVAVVADVWILLAAERTPANVDDSTTAAQLLWWNLGELPPDMRYLLGDQHYNTPLLRAICQGRDWVLVATRPVSPTDDGVEVRRVFHKLRSRAIEDLSCAPGLLKTSTIISRAFLMGTLKH